MNEERIELANRIGGKLFERLVYAQKRLNEAEAYIAEAKNKNDSANEEYWTFARRGADDRVEEVMDIIRILSKEF